MIEEVKADILNFMAERNAEIGHVLPERPFYSRVIQSYNPKQQDAIEPALASLVTEGLLEKGHNGYFLTELGYQHLYPSNEAEVIEEVKEDILDFLASCNARVGHALAERPYYFQRVSKYNPQQKKAIEPALSSLVSSGFLEQQPNGHFLTQSGYDHIYS